MPCDRSGAARESRSAFPSSLPADYNPPRMAYLRLHDVAVALGGRDVVREVSAEVEPGELIVVVGPNGAGKTTLLRAIAGLVAPRTGAIRVAGHDPLRAPRRV